MVVRAFLFVGNWNRFEPFFFVVIVLIKDGGSSLFICGQLKPLWTLFVCGDCVD